MDTDEFMEALCRAAFQVTELEVLRRKIGEMTDQAAMVAYFFPELRELMEETKKRMGTVARTVDERETEIIQAVKNGQNPMEIHKTKAN